jgi:hypothetical protein
VRTGLAWWIKGRILDRQGRSAMAREAYQAALPHLTRTVDESHPALQRLRLALRDQNQK